MSEGHLPLLQLFEWVNSWAIRFGYLCLEVGMYYFVDLLVVLCMSQIRVL